MDLCGTSQLISPAPAKVSSSVTKKFLFKRYDSNVLMTDTLKSIHSIPIHFVEVH